MLGQKTTHNQELLGGLVFLHIKNTAQALSNVLNVFLNQLQLTNVSIWVIEEGDVDLDVEPGALGRFLKVLLGVNDLQQGTKYMRGELNTKNSLRVGKGNRRWTWMSGWLLMRSRHSTILSNPFSPLYSSTPLTTSQTDEQSHCISRCNALMSIVAMKW